MPETYKVPIPNLSDNERKFLDEVKEALFKYVSDEDLQKIFLVDDKRAKFISDVKSASSKDLVLMPYELDLVKNKVKSLAEKYVESPTNDLIELLSMYLYSFGIASYLMLDPKIEEIMINGYGIPVYIAHRDKGICKTNLLIESQEELFWLVDRILVSGRIKERGKKIYDGSLEDSTRFNIALPPVSRQPTLTLRRFTPQPFSILELVKNGTMDLNIAAFLWLAVEGMQVRPANILIVGGASSGKTTTLNALMGFIPQGTRIITIEDVPELNLMNRENVVSLYTHYEKEKSNTITLKDLVKASLRMRPDRVVVGEVRGEEAEDLFVAMDIGCAGSMGTLHANSAKETILRLSSPPMSVPRTMIPLVDLIIVQQRMNVPGKGLIRRVVEVVEVGHIDNISLTTIFRWKPDSDTFFKSEIPPMYLDKLSKVTGRSKAELLRELGLRKEILSDMLRHGNLSYSKVYSELSSRLSNEVDMD